MWTISYKLTKVFKTPDVLGPLRTTLKLKSKIETLKSNLRLVQVLTNPGLKPRHWRSIQEIVGIDIKPNELTCLNDVLPDAPAIEKHIEKLVAIANLANKEFQLENTLQNMKLEWQKVKFTFVLYKNTQISVLSSYEDIKILIEDHLVKTIVIKNAPLFTEFRNEVDNWYNKLVIFKYFSDCF